MAWMLFFAAGAATLWLAPQLLFVVAGAQGAASVNWYAAGAIAVLALALAALVLCARLARRRHYQFARQAAHPLECSPEHPPIIRSAFPRASVCAAALLLGLVHAHWQAAQSLSHMLPAAYDRDEFLVEGVVRGVVARAPLQKYDGSSAIVQRFNFQVTALRHMSRSTAGYLAASPIPIESFNSDHRQPRRLRLSSYAGEPLAAGERWQMLVRLRSPRGLANPGSFDAVRFMLANHIDAYGYVREKFKPRRLEQDFLIAPAARLSNRVLTTLQVLRDARYQALQPLFQRLRHTEIYNALLLGEKSNLPAAHKLLLQRTGTSHLLAISGLHIGLAAGLGVLLGRLMLLAYPQLGLHLPRPLWLSLCSLPLAFFYAVLAGLALPTQRALIMLLGLACANFWLRHVHPFNHLVMALACVLLLDPLAVLASGMWLSFGAVALLIGCFAAYRHSAKLPVHARLPVTASAYAQSSLRKLHGAVRAQLAIFFGMPLVLAGFGLAMPVVAPLANLIVVPIIGAWVVPAGIFALLLSFLNMEAAFALLQFADLGLRVALRVLELVAGVSTLQLGHAALPPLVFAVAALATMAVLLGRRRAPFYGLAMLAWLMLYNPFGAQLATATRLATTPLQAGDFVLTQFDVGQGSAVLISTRQQHWLYDTGGEFGRSSDAGRAVILPALRRLGIAALDGAVVSHGDKDHAGGAASIAAAIPVAQWFAGGSARYKLANHKPLARSCAAGQQWIADRVKFEFIYPAVVAGLALKENDRSCVLKVTSLQAAPGSGSALLPGDISRAVEQQLVRQFASGAGSQAARVNVLVVPHHGSKTSSSEAFLDLLQPRYALLSAGFNNRYRHPHPGVVRRYLSRDIQLLRSDELGAIQLAYIAGHWRGPHCTRYRGRFFWQRWDNSQRCVGRLHKP